ncbi:MAG: putative glycogen debranching enzyme [Bryobacterales bacterium]|nr:putative glycogen debranching enzyme [Bryobacterales bacterium]
MTFAGASYASPDREWLETNGTGAFAMGTVAGLNTRRYHALLVASLKPPAERYVMLSRFEEEAVIGDRVFALSSCQYPSTLVNGGHKWLDEFRAEPCATWRYDLGGVKLEKQVYLVPDRQAVVVRYRSDAPLTLRLRPFLAYRDYHALAHANSYLDQGAEQSPGVVRVAPYRGLPPLEFRSKGTFTHDPHWYYNIEYLTELERGLDFREDLFTPGILTIDLQPGEWTPVCASIDGTEAVEPPLAKRDPFIVRRADGKPTIIAGYPWFTDWGRDTMISLPGLLIAPRRLDTAREIIEGFLQFRNQGIIPNRFPDAGETPEYNTADATLWMFQAVRAWLQAGGDPAFLRDVFYPAAKEIIYWHRRGTWYNIGVDPQDHLLSAGAPGVQLTWMDTKVTPRYGKPVEINALWHAALSLMADWGKMLHDPAAEDYRAEADRVRDSFRALFWNPHRKCLYDVLAPEGSIAQLRPNQIFAVSLPFGLLELGQQQAVVRIVERELLTPVGLRTLERADPDYKPRYEGSPVERDGAYHQGTVWPWLLGPFVDAYLVAFGKTEANLAHCRDLVVTLESEAAQSGCIGSIAEIYDAEEPRYPRGCPAQAWSVAEVARVKAGLFG